jgi:hypothetical protein
MLTTQTALQYSRQRQFIGAQVHHPRRLILCRAFPQRGRTSRMSRCGQRTMVHTTTYRGDQKHDHSLLRGNIVPNSQSAICRRKGTQVPVRLFPSSLSDHDGIIHPHHSQESSEPASGTRPHSHPVAGKLQPPNPSVRGQTW